MYNVRNKPIFRGFHVDNCGKTKILLDGVIYTGDWVEGYLNYNSITNSAFVVSSLNPFEHVDVINVLVNTVSHKLADGIFANSLVWHSKIGPCKFHWDTSCNKYVLMSIHTKELISDYRNDELVACGSVFDVKA